jgi:putative membrane protein insertion efficiency factor
VDCAKIALGFLKMRWLMIHFVLMYRALLSPIFGGQCRYVPTCSQYALDAINKYGALRGGWRAIKRISRCHPWGGSGIDPA